MIPNILFHEHYMFEHHKELVREMEQRRLLAKLPHAHFKLVRRLAAGVGTLLLAVGMRLSRLDVADKQRADEKGQAQESRINRTKVA